MTQRSTPHLKFKAGQLVYDQSWPYRRGRILKVLKTRLRVEWFEPINGEHIWTYDKAHQRFLRHV